jgi:hypothetical protein
MQLKFIFKIFIFYLRVIENFYLHIACQTILFDFFGHNQILVNQMQRNYFYT